MKKTLPFLFIIFVLTGCFDTKESVFLVPEGFTGIVVVIHDQPDGAPADFHFGKQFYEIPADGVLRTQVESRDDWVAKPSFYEGEVVEEKRMSLVEMNELDLETRNVYGFGHGSVYVSTQNDPVGYAQFFVSTSNEVDSLVASFESIDLVGLVQND